MRVIEEAKTLLASVLGPLLTDERAQPASLLKSWVLHSYQFRQYWMYGSCQSPTHWPSSRQTSLSLRAWGWGRDHAVWPRYRPNRQWSRQRRRL